MMPIEVPKQYPRIRTIDEVCINSYQVVGLCAFKMNIALAIANSKNKLCIDKHSIVNDVLAIDALLSISQSN